jgi:hypothetical protein
MVIAPQMQTPPVYFLQKHVQFVSLPAPRGHKAGPPRRGAEGRAAAVPPGLRSDHSGGGCRDERSCGRLKRTQRPTRVTLGGVYFKRKTPTRPRASTGRRLAFRDASRCWLRLPPDNQPIPCERRAQRADASDDAHVMTEAASPSPRSGPGHPFQSRRAGRVDFGC